MKVRYIKEGFFKTPEQAREARKKEAELSNTEHIAKLTNDLIVVPIKKFVDDVYNKWIVQRDGRIWGSANLFSDVLYVLPEIFSHHCIINAEKDSSLHCCISTWALKYEKVEINNIDLEKKIIDVTVIMGEPMHSVTTGTRPVITDRPITSEDVLFLRMDKFSDAVANELVVRSWIKSNKSQYPNMVSFLKNDYYTRDQMIGKPSNEVKQFINDASINISVKWKLENDILITGISGVEDAGLDGSELMWFPTVVSTNFAVSDIFSDVHLGDDNTVSGLYRQLACELYPLVKTVVKTIFNKFPKTHNVKNNISFDKFKERCDKESPSILRRFSSFEEIAYVFKKLFKHYNISVIGDHHIWYSTGYSEKNYMII